MCINTLINPYLTIVNLLRIIRANLNLLQRQPNKPATEASADDDFFPRVRSHTITGDTRPRSEHYAGPVKPAEPESQAAVPTIDSHKETDSQSEGNRNETTAVVPQQQVSSVGSDTERVDGSTDEERTDFEKSAQGPSISVSPPENEDSRRVTFGGAMEGEDETVKSKRDEEEGGVEQSAKGKHKQLGRSRSVDDWVRKSPGFLFITRPDLYKFAKVSRVVCYSVIHYLPVSF